MELAFYKYHATGNDFVMCVARDATAQAELEAALLNHPERVAAVCDRRFGVGADGLIAILPYPELAFEMRYHNADGKVGSMCGNGSRATLHRAAAEGLYEQECAFLAYDGVHRGRKLAEGFATELLIKGEVEQLPAEFGAEAYFIDTGSPHVVIPLPAEVDLATYDVHTQGKRLRHHARFAKQGGSNVNFIQQQGDGSLWVRTFERGVEAETYSCGTGVTASALVHTHINELPSMDVPIVTPGGWLRVQEQEGRIWLEGPAQLVYQGRLQPDDAQLPNSPLRLV